MTTFSDDPSRDGRHADRHRSDRGVGWHDRARVDPLAVNFSWVLHEPSTGRAVHNAIAASNRHRRHLAGVPRDAPIVVSVRWPMERVDGWLTAKIGAPQRFAALVASGLCFVDEPSDTPAIQTLFRGPATLNLPDASTTRVGVGAVVLRPGANGFQLVASGPYDWPTERGAALRAIERLIQAHAGQWGPRRALWHAPAEALLAGEVRERPRRGS